MSTVAYTVDVRIDDTKLRRFTAKMERLIESVRDVFGDEASLEFEIDADKTIELDGTHVIHPYCTRLEVKP